MTEQRIIKKISRPRYCIYLLSVQHLGTVYANEILQENENTDDLSHFLLVWIGHEWDKPHQFLLVGSSLMNGHDWDKSRTTFGWSDSVMNGTNHTTFCWSYPVMNGTNQWNRTTLYWSDAAIDSLMRQITPLSVGLIRSPIHKEIF